MSELKGVYYCYSYKNRIINEFQNPITTEVPPESFGLAVRRSMLMKTKEALAQNMNECRLFHVGYFDFNKGVFIPLQEPVEILDCLEVLSPHMPKEDKTDA